MSSGPDEAGATVLEVGKSRRQLDIYELLVQRHGQNHRKKTVVNISSKIAIKIFRVYEKTQWYIKEHSIKQC